MEEKRRPMDPTRKLLKVFGVKVTDYEARTRALVEQAEQDATTLPAALAEIAELTADLDHSLAEVTAHVLAAQQEVLDRLGKVARS